MRKFNSFRFMSFFFQHCIKNHILTLCVVAFASIYWAIDLQFRNWLIKEITEKLSFIDRNTALSQMSLTIYIYFSILILRLLVFNFSHYLRIYYMPLMKTNLLRYLMQEILKKSNVLLKKDRDLLSNQLQEILRNCESIINCVFINIFAHFTLLASSFVIFTLSHDFLLKSILSLYFLFFSISFIGYIKGVKLNREILSFDMVLFGRLNDVFANLFNIKLLRNYDYEEEKFIPFLETFTKTSMAKDFWNFSITVLLSLLFVFYNVGCMIFLFWQYQNGRASVADFPYIFAVNREVTEALWSIIDDINLLAEFVGKTQDSLEKVFSDIKLLSAKLDCITLDSYDIEYDNIEFYYPGTSSVLFDGLSLKINQGDKVGIVGYSGSGKSSLASLLLNLGELHSGSIKIGGVDIRLMPDEQLHSLITFMNQDLSLFNRSIKENIFYSKLNATDEEIVQAAKLANIHDFIDNLPNKYETVLEYQGRELSQGQKQRILIARAFLRDTPILILDEVTSSLDAKSEHMVMDSLVKLMKNKTVLVIAHKLKTLFGMNYLIGMNKGKIIEKGTHKELLEKKSIYYELLNG